MYNPRLKDKHALVDLARYGTEARKSIHPDVLIGEHCVKCPPFREGDILDANATVNLIGDTLDCCEVFQTFDEEGQRIAERLDNLEQTQSENYTELSDKVDSLTETHEQDIARLDDKTDNLALNIINQERVVDISKLSEVGGKTSYLVTKQDGSHDTIIVAKGDKGDQGESFSYEDFTPEQLEALKVKGDKGDKGTSITRVQQTTVAYNDRGVNVVTIDLDDGSSSLIQIRNGAGGGDSLQVKQDLQAEIARATSAENALQNNINSVNSRVDHIVEDAPEALDTLLEIAEKLHDEEDAVAALTLEISQKYTKPDTGIPSSDMSESVRASLSKADTALQQHLDISGKADLADLATVATTGEYSDLLNKPVIPTVPTNVSAFTNDAGYLTLHQDISGKANIADLATVATSGSYNDLINKPVIPSLNGYATEQWVQNQNYLTEHQDISSKADKTDLDDYLKNYIEIDHTGGHDYVEIGGIKWATMNIGALSITDTGLYFQWGDISGYTASQCGSGEGLKYFNWVDYKYGNGTNSPANGMSKYNSNDGKTVLEASDDAEKSAWGDNWRMPTTAEYAALSAAVNTEWTTDYQGSGVAGMICTDKTDSSKVLFFPACGYCGNGRVYYTDTGNYWSSSLDSSYVRSAYCLNFFDGRVNWSATEYRYRGLPVRGVYIGPEPQRISVFGATEAEKTTWNNKSDFSGSYNDLTDKPTIPTVAQSDWDQSDSTAIDYIKNKPTIPVMPVLAAVATSGDYADLINTPTIPSDYVDLTSNQTITGAKTFKGVDRIVLLGNTANEKPGFAINTSTGVKAGFLEYRGNDKMMVLGIDNHTNVGNNLFKIGFREYSSYSYNATIPLGVNKNDTFGTGDVVIPIAVNGVKAGNDGNILITIPTVPTNVSAFTNDAGYVTSSDFDNIGTATIISIVDAAIAEANKDESVISFDTDTANINTGETITKTVTVTAGDGAVTYSSSDTDVATVDNSGVVTGVNAGTCTITASIASTSTYKAATASYSLSVELPRVIAKYNVTSTSSGTRILHDTNNISKIEIDGVEQRSVSATYTFDSTGEHTVKYTLTNITNIGDYTFLNCSNLTSIIIPNGVLYITGFGLYGCFTGCTGLTSITIPNSVTSIGDSAFSGCTNLTSINIPDSVTSISLCAFLDCTGLTSITIPNSITSINVSTFSGCTSLTSINIPVNVTSIGGGAFSGCTNLTSVTLGNSVTSIGDSAFKSCKNLTSITIPNSVTSIKSSAFLDCTGLTSVTLGNSVTSISYRAFRGCSKLATITSNATTAPTINSYTFENIKTGGTLYVPVGSTGYDTWISTDKYYLGRYNWTKVEQ